jgi:signal transduction histidine kinase/ligand-binding sensor domain-containing protein
LLAGFFLLLAVAVFADDTNVSWRTRSWQTDDGLPDNSVESLAQGSDGYLWIGTPSGLTRFDGIRFDNFSLTNVIASPNRGIITMVSDQHGGLWLAMDRGAVVYLNGRYSRAYSKGLPDLIPYNLAQDAAGGLLIAYRAGSACQIKGDKVIELTAQQGLPEGLDNCALARDNQGRIWFGKAGQVGIFHDGVFKTLCQVDSQPIRLALARDGGVWICAGVHLFKSDENGKLQDFGQFHPESSGTLATALIEDHEGVVWIGTSFSGLFRHSQSGFETIPTSHQGILSLMEDREGNIWVGTFGGGLDRVRPRSITLEGMEAGLPFSSIQSICEDTNGTIWAVTQNGVLVRKSGDQWSAVPVDSQWPGNATCVTADSQGAIWIGTRRHGIYYWRDGNFIAREDIRQIREITAHTLLVSQTGDLWIGQETPGMILRLHDGHIKTYEIPPDSRVIRAMVEDADGNVWAGTSKGILLRVVGDHVETVMPRPSQELASIRCLYTTSDGALWIGYAGWGLGCLRNGRYAEINSQQGLYDDYISHIIADGHGWLWFGANRGIFKVRIKDLKDVIAGRTSRVRSVHYGRVEGLPGLQGVFGSSPDVLRSRDGRLWIPMQTALVVVDPAKQEQRPEPPAVLLTQVSLDDQTVAHYDGILPKKDSADDGTLNLSTADTKLYLPAGHRRLEFDFSAFSFEAPENVQFRYRLNGFDDDWVDAGTRRNASYPRLPSGNYKFEVTACNNDGDWNKTSATLNLVVAQFFWQSWWFRSAVLAVFTGSIIAIVRYVSFRRLRRRLIILEQQSALQKERARIAKDIHDDLGASLTQIAFLGELAQQDRGEPDKAAERMGNISTTARQAIKSLDEIVWAVNPRNDTLAHLIEYAGQFALDYLRLADIRCRLDFPDQSPPRELSTDLRHNLFLAIKEALNNIVKHARASEVWLRIVFSGQALDMIIEDNGHGFEREPDDALADGLRNMRQRLADIGGECRIESRPGIGTKIILHLPWPCN